MHPAALESGERKEFNQGLLNELEVVKSRVKELECSGRLEKAELSLKDDLTVEVLYESDAGG